MFCFANCITVSHRLFARHLKIWNFRKWYLRKHLWNSSKMPLKCLWNASKMPPKRLPSASKSYLLSSCKSWIEGKKLPSIQLLPLGLMDPIRHGAISGLTQSSICLPAKLAVWRTVLPLLLWIIRQLGSAETKRLTDSRSPVLMAMWRAVQPSLLITLLSVLPQILLKFMLMWWQHHHMSIIWTGHPWFQLLLFKFYLEIFTDYWTDLVLDKTDLLLVH